MRQITTKPETNIGSLYDTYSAMLYGMALQVSTGTIQAEAILVSTFVKINSYIPTIHNSSASCTLLIKLFIESANEVLDAKQAKNIQVKLFTKTPLIHNMLCEGANITTYCEANNITRLEAGKKMRA